MTHWYRTIANRYAPRPRRPYEYLINRYYAHRVDPVLTWLADLAGLSPNTVTLISLAAGLGAAAGIIGGHYLAAALLVQLHHLLDGVDGNLARAHDRCTEFGRRLDVFVDQTVRLAVFASLAYTAEVPAWLAWTMLATLYIDPLLVEFFITPFAQRQPLLRSRWKQWFMDRGLMPAFDIFTIYFIVSICLAVDAPATAVLLVTLLKTLDWSYRLYECVRTRFAAQRHGQTS